ncbi:hypothetical protein ACJX0J_033718, partial [Zea mays]
MGSGDTLYLIQTIVDEYNICIFVIVSNHGFGNILIFEFFPDQISLLDIVSVNLLLWHKL